MADKAVKSRSKVGRLTRISVGCMKFYRLFTGPDEHAFRAVDAGFASELFNATMTGNRMERVAQSICAPHIVNFTGRWRRRWGNYAFRHCRYRTRRVGNNMSFYPGDVPLAEIPAVGVMISGDAARMGAEPM